MSLLYIDGFDSYDHLGHKWERGNNNIDMFTLVSGAGRTDGHNALVFTSYLWKQTAGEVYSTSDYRCDTYDALCWFGLGRKIPETNDVIIGCAIKTHQVDPGYLDLELRKGETIQSKIRYRMEEVTVTDANDNVLGTNNNRDILNRKIMHHEQWNYVEVYVSFSTVGSGSVTIRANENIVFTGTDLDTAVDSNSIDNIRFYMSHTYNPTPATEFARIDDLYIANSSGTANNTFLGNINVKSIYPYQDTAYSGFTLASGTISGTSHYTQVTNKQQNNVTEHNHVYWINSNTDDGDTFLGVSHQLVEIASGPVTYSFFRFTGVNLPRKAKINSALLFLRWNSGSLGSPKYLNVNVQNSGRSEAITSSSQLAPIWARGHGYDANGRLKIYRYHAYNAGGSPSGYYINIWQLLQVLVDRDDWQEVNNSFTVLIYSAYYTSSTTQYYRRVYGWLYDDANGTDYRANISVDFEVPYAKDTYLHTTSTGVAEAFNYDTTGISGTVYGIQQNMNTSHIDSLYYSRLSHKAFSVVSGTSYSGSGFYTNDGLGTNLSNNYIVYDVNPKTNSAWTQQTIADAAFGITTVSGYLGNTDFDHWS